MPRTDVALALVLGLAIGALMGWFLRSFRARPVDTRVEDELRSQRAVQDGELLRLRGELTQATSARAGLEAELVAERKMATALRAEAERAHEGSERLREAGLALQKRNGELESESTYLNERLRAERVQIETLQERFSREFEAISNKLLVQSSARFNQQSSDSLEKLLNPLKETLGDFRTSLDSTRKETATHSALLKEQISRVGAEAANLSRALKGDVKMLGNWGENMLDQILEKSGLQRDLHYRRQQGARDLDGDQRYLDVIVELPESRNLIIDSKVSLRSYEEAVNCADDDSRHLHLERHVEAVRSHFRGLGGKRYQDIHAINSPDLVLMYIPIEGAFFAAVAHQPALFADALEENVVLITNSTLLAALRTVAHVWRLADQQKHAIEIAERGGLLYDKFVGFLQDLENIGKALRSGETAWEEAMKKLQSGRGNLVSQAQQLKELGVKAAKAIPPAILEKALEETSNASASSQIPSDSCAPKMKIV